MHRTKHKAVLRKQLWVCVDSDSPHECLVAWWYNNGVSLQLGVRLI